MCKGTCTCACVLLGACVALWVSVYVCPHVCVQCTCVHACVCAHVCWNGQFCSGQCERNSCRFGFAVGMGHYWKISLLSALSWYDQPKKAAQGLGRCLRSLIPKTTLIKIQAGCTLVSPALGEGETESLGLDGERMAW